MKKKSRYIITLVLAVILSLCAGFVACSSGGVDVKRPNKLVFDGDPSKSEGSMPIDLDATGLFNKVKGIDEVENGVLMPDFYSGLSGEPVTDRGAKIVASATGAETVYTRVVNLKNLKDDVINMEVIYDSVYDMKLVSVSLIDIYDSSNEITVSWKRHPNLVQPYSYMLVSVNGSEGVGRDNETGSGKVRSEYGSLVWTCGLNGGLDKDYPDAHNFPHVPLNFSFDYETQQIRSRIQQDGGAWTVLDLDDDLGSASFNGFRTGEVYVKIVFSEIVKKGAVTVRSIAGNVTDDTEKTSVPQNNVKLDMDLDYFYNALPNGAVGYDFPLPVPVASDYIQGETAVGAEIYKGGEKLEGLISDGIFKPKSAGDYKLVFYSSDVNGLRSEKVFDVKINDAPERIEIAAEYDSATFLHNRYGKLPVFTADGGNGKLTFQTEYYYNGNKVEADLAGKIFLSDLGTVKTVAKVIDYIGSSAEKTIELQVIAGQEILLKSGISNSFMAGKKIVLPDFTAIDYTRTAGESGYEMLRSIYADGVKLSDSREYTVPENKRSVTIEYRGENADHVVKKTFEVSIISPADSGSLSGFFTSENCFVKDGAYGINLKSSAEKNSVKFPYFISTEFMAIDLETVIDKCFYDYIQLSMTDSLNPEIKAVIRIVKDNAGYVVATKDGNGKFKTSAFVNKALAERQVLSYYYENSSRTIMDGIFNNVITIDYCENGDAFNGFSSNAVSLEISFGQTLGMYSELLIKKIGNQDFSVGSYEFGDMIAPELSFSAEIKNDRVREGETRVIPAAYGYDVLTGCADITVSLRSPSGNYLFENLPATEERTVTFTEYGAYSVIYVAYDEYFNKAESYYTFNVTDVTPPELKVDGSIGSSYKAGEKIKIPGFSAKDNYTEADKLVVYCMVYMPNLEMRYLAPGEEFVFGMLGHYEFVFVARDATYNVSRITYETEIG